MRPSEQIETIQGQRVTVRPLSQADLPDMVRILAEPEVRRWWGTFDEARIIKEVYGDEDLASYAIVFEGRVVGSIHWHEQDEPDYKRAGMDIFVETASHGMGIGADALTAVARYLFEVRGHHAIDIDPHVGNAHAIRAYERIGFKPVGVRRRYERGDDGTWHDNLLMDLLPEEMIVPPLDE
jgi:aminoglycoside 6'-N-acetyltransferase